MPFPGQPGTLSRPTAPGGTSQPGTNQKPQRGERRGRDGRMGGGTEDPRDPRLTTETGRWPFPQPAVQFTVLFPGPFLLCCQ